MKGFIKHEIKKLGLAVKWFLIISIVALLGGIIGRIINNQAIGLLLVVIISYMGFRYMKKDKVKLDSLKEVKRLLNSNSLISDELISKLQIEKSSSLFNQIKTHNEKVLLKEVKRLLNSNSLISDELISKLQIEKSSSLFNQIKTHNEKVLEYQKELEKQRELEEEKERKKEEKRYNSLIKKYGEEMVKKSYNEEVFLNQPKELLIISMGEPEDVKKSVTKDKVREIFFYTPYQTHLKTTNYRYSVTLENKIVVGYKDLN